MTQSIIDRASPAAFIAFRQFVERHAVNLITGFFILLPLLCLIGYFFPPINHDTAAILSFSRRWLSGERLYIDLIDINMPMVFLIHAIPVLMADLIKLSIPTALTLFFVICIGLSLLACHRLLSRHIAIDRPLTHWLSILLLFYFYILFPGENFGQREHLMMLAAYPYVFLSVARAEGCKISLVLRLLIALSAAIALGQKPFFLPIFVVVEVYLFWRQGWRRELSDPVPWAIILLLFGYLLWALAFLPAYFTDILPAAFGDYSKLGEGTAIEVLLDRYMGPTIFLLGMLTLAAFVLSSSDLKRIVALFAIGAAISNIMQAKGWPYHVMPVQTATFLLIALFLSGALDRLLVALKGNWRMPAAIILAAVMTIVYYASFTLQPPFQKQLEFSDSPTAQLLRIVKRHARNGGMLVFSPGIYPFYPLVLYARAQMVMPYMTMWVLQGLYHDCEADAPLYREPEDMSAFERQLFENMGQILAERRPEVIIVDRVPGMPRCHEAVFDYLEYFQRNSVFAEAFKDYEYVTIWDRYVIYRRLS